MILTLNGSDVEANVWDATSEGVSESLPPASSGRYGKSSGEGNSASATPPVHHTANQKRIRKERSSVDEWKQGREERSGIEGDRCIVKGSIWMGIVVMSQVPDK